MFPEMTTDKVVPVGSLWLILCLCSAVDVPFSRWSKDEVCAWLHEQGLGLYVAQGQNWIKSGQTLLQASQYDLEKVGVLPVLKMLDFSVLSEQGVVFFIQNHCKACF